MYVVFEGIDTCGKSTQLELLKPIFPDAIFTKEPGGSPLGVKIREILLDEKEFHLDPLAEFFLFLADRAQLSSSLIAPMRKEHLILSDRSLLSGIAYAKDELFSNLSTIDLNLLAVQNILPDKIILFETTKELLLKRLETKNNDSIELRGIEYLLDIQDRLKHITFKLCKDKEILLLDASKDITSLHTQILNFLKD